MVKNWFRWQSALQLLLFWCKVYVLHCMLMSVYVCSWRFFLLTVNIIHTIFYYSNTCQLDGWISFRYPAIVLLTSCINIVIILFFLRINLLACLLVRRILPGFIFQTMNIAFSSCYFLSRVSMLYRDIVLPILFVHLSVFPMPVLCLNECTYHIFWHSSGGIVLIFWTPLPLQNWKANVKYIHSFIYLLRMKSTNKTVCNAMWAGQQGSKTNTNSCPLD